MEPVEDPHGRPVGPEAAQPASPRPLADNGPVVPVRDYTRVPQAAVVETRVYDPRLERAVWFIVGLISALIAIRFLMKLLGASYQADFVRFTYGVTAVLVAPFRGIFQASGSGNYILEPESLIAIAIYVLMGWGAVTLVRIVRAPRTL